MQSFKTYLSHICPKYHSIVSSSTSHQNHATQIGHRLHWDWKRLVPFSNHYSKPIQSMCDIIFNTCLFSVVYKFPLHSPVQYHMSHSHCKSCSQPTRLCSYYNSLQANSNVRLGWWAMPHRHHVAWHCPTRLSIHWLCVDLQCVIHISNFLMKLKWYEINLRLL